MGDVFSSTRRREIEALNQALSELEKQASRLEGLDALTCIEVLPSLVLNAAHCMERLRSGLCSVAEYTQAWQKFEQKGRLTRLLTNGIAPAFLFKAWDEFSEEREKEVRAIMSQVCQAESDAPAVLCTEALELTAAELEQITVNELDSPVRTLTRPFRSGLGGCRFTPV